METKKMNEKLRKENDFLSRRVRELEGKVELGRRRSPGGGCRGVSVVNQVMRQEEGSPKKAEPQAGIGLAKANGVAKSSTAADSNRQTEKLKLKLRTMENCVGGMMAVLNEKEEDTKAASSAGWRSYSRRSAEILPGVLEVLSSGVSGGSSATVVRVERERNIALVIWGCCQHTLHQKEMQGSSTVPSSHSPATDSGLNVTNQFTRGVISRVTGVLERTLLEKTVCPITKTIVAMTVCAVEGDVGGVGGRGVSTKTPSNDSSLTDRCAAILSKSIAVKGGSNAAATQTFLSQNGIPLLLSAVGTGVRSFGVQGRDKIVEMGVKVLVRFCGSTGDVRREFLDRVTAVQGIGEFIFMLFDLQNGVVARGGSGKRKGHGVVEKHLSDVRDVTSLICQISLSSTDEDDGNSGSAIGTVMGGVGGARHKKSVIAGRMTRLLGNVTDSTGRGIREVLREFVRGCKRVMVDGSEESGLGVGGSGGGRQLGFVVANLESCLLMLN